MNQVRLRSRRTVTTLAALTRAREIQGKLAMPGLELEPDPAASVATGPFETRTFRRDGEVKPMPYRQVLATWPDDWRQRWGRRANDLEESGLSWRDAEGRAFVETWSNFRASGQTERN